MVAVAKEAFRGLCRLPLDQGLLRSSPPLAVPGFVQPSLQRLASVAVAKAHLQEADSYHTQGWLITHPEHPWHHIFLLDLEAEVERILPALFTLLCDLGEIVEHDDEAGSSEMSCATQEGR
jgi:hypothetical protein